MGNFLLQNPWVIILFLLWTLPWKGAALWRAARRGHAGWFIVFLVVNTLSILEIIYLFIVTRQNKQEAQEMALEKFQAENKVSNGALRPRTYQDFQTAEDSGGETRKVKKIM